MVFLKECFEKVDLEIKYTQMAKSMQNYQACSVLRQLLRPPDKSAYWKTIFFMSYPKHMLWVFKRSVPMRRFFLAPKT